MYRIIEKLYFGLKQLGHVPLLSLAYVNNILGTKWGTLNMPLISWQLERWSKEVWWISIYHAPLSGCFLPKKIKKNKYEIERDIIGKLFYEFFYFSHIQNHSINIFDSLQNRSNGLQDSSTCFKICALRFSICAISCQFLCTQILKQIKRLWSPLDPKVNLMGIGPAPFSIWIYLENLEKIIMNFGA